MSTPIELLLKAASDAWRPPQKMTLSEWSDKYAFMSAESAASEGKWRTLPYQKGFMDAMTDPTVEMISIMKSARVGYTKCLNNLIGYHAHQDPCPIMVVQPTEGDAEGYSKDEIAPMLRDTKVLKKIFADAKAKNSNNTILSKSFPGGVIQLVGATSPAGFRRVSRRILAFDEVDGYPASAGSEGDPIKLGTKRTEYYWNRKIIAGSTPTIKGISRIERLFLDSDQRRFFVPCPHCGEFQFLRWSKETFIWPKGEPLKAYYVCEHNGCVIQHSEKYGMIEKGEWRATAVAKVPGRIGFHIWAAYSYSPNASWGQLAQEFVDSKDDPELLKTFINTALGETWSDSGSEGENWETLLARVEPYDPLTVPAGGLMLTMGVDVQDNRLAVKIKAYGVNGESWLVYWTEIYGDPAGDELWDQIDNLIDRDYLHASGKTMRITATAVDSGGHHTQRVYAFARDRREKNVIAIKGANSSNQPVRGKPTEQDVDHRGKKIKKGVKLWPVGTDTAKAIIYARARVTTGQGHMHFYAGLDPSYFKQLTSEVRVPKYEHGRQTGYIWMTPKKGIRNEALDCEVYCLAAAYHAGIERYPWEKLQKTYHCGNLTVSHTISTASEVGSMSGKQGHQEPEPVVDVVIKKEVDRDLLNRRRERAGGGRGGWMNGWR